PGTAGHPARLTTPRAATHVMLTGEHIGQHVPHHHAARDTRRGGQCRAQKTGAAALEHAGLIAGRVLRRWRCVARRRRIPLRGWWCISLRRRGLLPSPRSGIGRRRRLRTATTEKAAEKPPALRLRLLLLLRLLHRLAGAGEPGLH